jgi:arsenite methyltransferase
MKRPRDLDTIGALASYHRHEASVVERGDSCLRRCRGRPVGPSAGPEARVASLKIDYIIASLGLKPGQTVADIGAGPGVLDVPLAQAVGASGKVYAVDIDAGFFPHIKQKADAAHLKNIHTVLGAPADPKLPAKDVDVALFHDVLHHIEDRAGYLKALAGYMKPGSRIAVVELPPDGSHKDEPALIVTKDQVKTWMAAADFAPVQEYDGLPGKWFIVYGRS